MTIKREEVTNADSLGSRLGKQISAFRDDKDVQTIASVCRQINMFALLSLKESFGDKISELVNSIVNRDVSNFTSALISASNEKISSSCLKVDQLLFVANAFINECPTVSNFKYNPRNCDPGYWCGCSDPSLQSCDPSNNLSSTFWAGHYTDTSNLMEPIVYTGWASRFPPNYFKCNNTMYCPGRDASVNDCPQLCKAGHYCPTPKEQKICPRGFFCRQGSTSPTKCYGLDHCKEPGLSEPGASWFFALVVSFSIVVFFLLYLSYLFLNQKFPFRRKEEMEVEETDEETARGKMRKQRSSVTLPKPKIKIDVKFSDLQLTLKNGICIMQGVTGSLKRGQFTAIMGPSGAGKSTFLSLLSGKTEPTGGVLLVNGKEASLKDYRSIVGFVPQEDIMLRELSVEENIRHSAFMRLPASMSTQKKLKRVYQVMESLDLLRIRNSIIGDEIVRGISGGQRKRVNVAMELVADPSLLALDEPTSGLDSTTSSNLCETLSELAMTGVNVAAVIHQPKLEILEKFSDVLLLGVGGRTVYMGKTEGMEAYFDKIGFPLPAQMNPADFYMDVIAGLVPCTSDPNFKKEDLFDMWKKHMENEFPFDEDPDECTEENDVSEKAERQDRKAAGFFMQTYLLFKRAILQRCRVPQATYVPATLSAGTGCLMGYFVKNITILYYGIPRVVEYENPTTNAATRYMSDYPIPPRSSMDNIWLFTALSVMLITIVSINTFGREQAVFNRESFSGTKSAAYWLAKTVEEGIWLPLYAAIFVTVCLIFQPQPIEVEQFFFVVWMSLLGDCGIGHIVSLVVAPSNRGIVHLVSCLVLIMLFSGSMINYQGKRFFNVFYTFWAAQGYAEGFLEPYSDAFDIYTLNSRMQGYDLEYPFAFNILCAALTGIIWHLVALVIMMIRLR